MFFRIILESVVRNPRRKILASAVLILASAVAAAALTVALDEGTRLAQQFESFGANIEVTPQADTVPLEIGGLDTRPVTQGAYLKQANLGRLKRIFWRNNIKGFAPYLEVPVTIEGSSGPVATTLVGSWYKHAVPVAGQPAFVTGLEATSPWWRVKGNWFAGGAGRGTERGTEQCMVGRDLAHRLGIRPGQEITIKAGGETKSLLVTGVVTTGGSEDRALVGPLSLAQQLANRPGEYRRLEVTAVTKPEDAFGRQDPHTMTHAEYDRWYCSAYPSSIATQIQQVLPGSSARVVQRVAASEGQILGRVSALFWLITLGAMAAATLAIAAMAAASVIERRGEVALMKALGATSGLLASFFLAEQMAVAVLGGAVGFGLGTLLARGLGRLVFGVASSPQPLLLPIVLAIAAVVVAAGSLVPLRRMMRLDPAPILRGE
ncbi:MAG TPA: ABC transporter permease [Candidatus Dormibacteraeota bacterium]|nr:ABC transporter permease [Candidatus Dormibacteraeota bacterium]